MPIDLSKLAEPFPAQDIEWRVSRAGVGKNGVFCNVLAYITARAIQQRLDDVCGPANWRNEPMAVHEVRAGLYAIQVGISIWINEEGTDPEWITKYDVSEPTNIEAAKGGFSGAMKRAGAQWGIGRYLYHLDEAFAETSDERVAGWNYATLAKADNRVYYWKPPALPAWALPKEEEHEVGSDELNSLKAQWREKFAPGINNRAELVEGFERFVTSTVGEFPLSDHTCWTRDAIGKCFTKINTTTDPNGISSDVPFEE